jgi:GR25 family glycosyltransferase involved in LPS biosynthesis
LGIFINKRINGIRKAQYTYYYNYLSEKYKKQSHIYKDLHKNQLSNIPIYYINMDKDISRRNFIENQSLLYNIKINRISAINGKEKNLKNDKIELYPGYNIPYFNNYSITNSELGCTLSHIKAIYTSYKNNDELALIIEDDTSFVLVPYWDKTIKQVIDNAPTDWTIIKLFRLGNYNSKQMYKKYDEKRNLWSTVAYIINRQGMKKLLFDIIKGNKLVLDKDTSGKKGTSDYLIYYRAKNAYDLKDIYFIPNNNQNDSTIHTSDTNTHIKKCLEYIETYLRKIKSSS